LFVVFGEACSRENGRSKVVQGAMRNSVKKHEGRGIVEGEDKGGQDVRSRMRINKSKGYGEEEV